MFGNSMSILQNNKTYGGEDLIQPISKNFFIDLTLNQYLLGLGEF